MTRSIGIVIPAYQPDPERLTSYLQQLDSQVTPSPAVLRIELDDPSSSLLNQLYSRLSNVIFTASVEIAIADTRRGKGAAITAGFERLCACTNTTASSTTTTITNSSDMSERMDIDSGSGESTNVTINMTTSPPASTIDVLAFVDADGSTPASSFETVLGAIINDDADVAAGSRRHPSADVAAHQTLGRRYLGDGFAWLARRFLDEQLYDYQCGAKAITTDAWQAVRSHIYATGFAWDIELLAISSGLGYHIAEVPVCWKDQPGSTVSPLRTALRLGRALVTARHRTRVLAHNPVHQLLASIETSSQPVIDSVATSEPTRLSETATAVKINPEVDVNVNIDTNDQNSIEAG
ncbi:MAG: hypothetical protein J07HQW2_02854 [Haloquadratum walsbyi J07HQW2]|jgi:hypothetical protein|uniref:Glycosyltransferase n=2 Tax=Haloquadratum walsbyi TaxID=293091 RepID=U1PRK3_9EURY|nr:MAG: hypothetical protein J07HQW2_02854 [Haloquadratum walsbyi J07HQW2]